jgi:hypothetical protein
MIPADLLEKYGLHEKVAAEAVEAAVARVLSRALGMDMVVRLDSQLEVMAWRRGRGDIGEPVRIEPGVLSRQLQRQVRHHLERELEKQQVLREWGVLRNLRGQAVPGEILRIRPDGSLAVALGIEETFRSLVLTGECPLRAQPARERPLYRVGETRQFLVTSVLPVRVRGKAKVRVLLSRTSRELTEVLLRERGGEGALRCRRRIAGAFSEVETDTRIPKEAVLTVSRELGERIRIHVLAPKKD